MKSFWIFAGGVLTEKVDSRVMASVLFMDFTVVKQSVTFNKPLQLALSLNDENELYEMP